MSGIRPSTHYKAKVCITISDFVPRPDMRNILEMVFKRQLISLDKKVTRSHMTVMKRGQGYSFRLVLSGSHRSYIRINTSGLLADLSNTLGIPDKLILIEAPEVTELTRLKIPRSSIDLLPRMRPILVRQNAMNPILLSVDNQSHISHKKCRIA